MTQIAERIIAAARIADARLAGRDTPFLFEHWYVAAFVTDVGRTPLARTILGRPLMFFRKLDGTPVAMSDRCVHRSFPLSKSRLDGDTVVCGYHGARYASSGLCMEVPAQGGVPRGLGVRSYPLREQGPLVWIWMGDGEPASDLPGGEWIADSAWPASNAYFAMKANYISLHENLLDLSHLTFLHANTFGTPDYALAPYTVDTDDEAGRFAIKRSVIPTKLPPVWAKPTGIGDRDAARITRTEFCGPSVQIIDAQFYALDVPEDQRGNAAIRTAHLVTPETNRSTHYFIHHGRNFGLSDPSITGFMHEQLSAAFEEDVEGLEAVENMVAKTPPEDRYEISVASDRAGLAMRRWIARQAEEAARQDR